MNAIKPGIDAYFGHPSVPSSEMKPGYYHPSRYSFRIELATIQYLWLVLFERVEAMMGRRFVGRILDCREK